MPHARPSDIRNRLLQALAVDDFERLVPLLKRSELPIRTTLVSPGVPIERVTFLESGIVSLTTAASQNRVEVGLIGREGAVGASPILLHAKTVPYTAFMQVGGEGLAIEASLLLRLAEDRPTLRRTLLRYVQTEIAQARYTAFANATGSLEMRLARWLLMYHDRVDEDVLPIKHEFLSFMLGVHRPGVTLAVQALEGAGYIRGRRMRIEVLDRGGLERAAGGSYGQPEIEYATLIDAAAARTEPSAAAE